MRALILFLLVAAAAVGVALFVRYNGGYVMFVSPPWRVELSQNAYVLLTIVAFALMYGAIRLAIRIARLPQEVRAHRRKSDDVRQRSRQDGALIALLEGRYGRARELAEQALTLTPDTGVAALIGARAALETRDFAAAGRFLAHPDVQAQRFAVPRMMLDAELALEQGMAGEALAKLADLKREAGAHTAALRLELRALNAASRPDRDPARRRRARQAQGVRQRAGRDDPRQCACRCAARASPTTPQGLPITGAGCRNRIA